MILIIQPIIDSILAPFRAIYSKWFAVTSLKGSAQGDVNRVKGYVNRGKQGVQKAKDGAQKVGAYNAQAQAVGGQVQQAGQQVGQQAQQVGQANKKAKKKMGLFGKKNVCPNCGQPQEKGWDKCPFCIPVAGPGGPTPSGQGQAPGGFGAGAPGAYGAPPPAGGGGGAQKTVAFMAGGAPGAAGMQLCGWVIPLKGPHRGELHTLKSQSVIGKDPTCDVVFNDPYMSSRHATIRVQGGLFILEDHSTNGTFVNDKKVRSHELVDNDFIKFGQTLVKFKSL